MGTEYGPAIDMFNDDPAYVFVGALTNVPGSEISIVCHKTASGGPTTATAIANYFHDNPDRVSSHFIVGKDGSVIQVVRLANGSGANCCTTTGYNAVYWAPYVQKYGNLNLCTISIEHEDWTTDNSDPMSDVQVQASNELVKWLCQKYGIDSSHIHSHASIDPVNRSRCPGPTFDFNQLFSFLQKPSALEVDAQNVWNSTAFLFGNSPLSYESGIALSWRDRRINQGKLMPPPTTREYDSVDWNGNAVVCQMFGIVQAVYYPNGTTSWYLLDGS